jgi:hypothetical protein
MSDEHDTTAGGRASANGPFARFGAELDNLLRSVIPSGEAVDHFTKARVEMLKGVRAIIDARIDHLSSESGKGVSIKIE